MWKLTITQRTKESYVKDEIEIIADDITELTTMICNFSLFKHERNTSYKIEKVGEEND